MLGQRRLKNAGVLVVGAGGLGSPALLYLAAAGVGRIGIADFDMVEESNLQRQVIHGARDVGRPKTESAREAIAEVNPLVDVVAHEGRVDASTALSLVSAYDLVVDGTDNFASRYLLNDACVLAAKPYVWGSIFRFTGQVSIFWAQHGPCYRCLYPEPPAAGAVPSCAEGGVLGVLCGSVGSAQATEAVKLLTGVGRPLVGRVQVYDALDMSWREVAVRKDPHCAVCGERPTISELADYAAFCGERSAAAGVGEEAISVRTLAEWLAARDRGERDFVLVDVREPSEREINAIPGSVLVPVREFVSGEGLAKLPADRQPVFYCKVGVRSAAVLELARQAGRADAVHVAGGVAAWVSEVDPGQPAY